MVKRQRLTAVRWRQLIDRQLASGLGVEAFCRRHGVASSTFFAWRQKLRASAEPVFVELTEGAAPAGQGHAGTATAASGDSTVAAPIELLLPGGVTVRVRSGFDASTLRAVVEALS